MKKRAQCDLIKARMTKDCMKGGSRTCPANDDCFTKQGYVFCGRVRAYSMSDLEYLKTHEKLECFVARDTWLFARPLKGGNNEKV